MPGVDQIAGELHHTGGQPQGMVEQDHLCQLDPPLLDQRSTVGPESRRGPWTALRAAEAGLRGGSW